MYGDLEGIIRAALPEIKSLELEASSESVDEDVIESEDDELNL